MKLTKLFIFTVGAFAFYLMLMSMMQLSNILQTYKVNPDINLILNFAYYSVLALISCFYSLGLMVLYFISDNPSNEYSRPQGVKETENDLTIE